MRPFTFLAKQGQHNDIARLLTANVGKPRLSEYNGPRGQGVLIALALPEGVSKRSVDRLLHNNKVPGSVSRRNRMRVFKETGGWLDIYHVADQIGFNTLFKLVRNGKFITAQVDYYDYGCTCCGGYHRLLDRHGDTI